MDRIVDWGHWVIATLFAVHAILNFNLSLLRVLHSQHILEGLWPSLVKAPSYVPIAGILFLACAWGIFKWRTWAHTLAVVLCAINLLVFLFGSSSFHRPILMLSISMTFAAMLVWLLLPSVRAKFAKVV